MCDIFGKSVRFGTLFFLYNKSRKEITMLDMNKLVDLLLKQEELKDVPMKYIFKVVSSVFYIINNEDVFYKEKL